MALPVGVSLVTVTLGPFLDFQGNALAGQTVFTPSSAVLHTATGTPVLNKPIVVPWGVLGTATVQLPATDDPSLTPINFLYSVQHSFEDRSIPTPPVVPIQLPRAVPTVDLDLLIPASGTSGVTVNLPAVSSVAGYSGTVTGAQLAAAPELRAASVSAVKESGAVRLAGVGGGDSYRVGRSDLPGWRKARARVLGRAGDAKVLCIGDSTVWGSGATVAGPESWPGRLAAVLRGMGLPSAQGLSAPPIAAATDARWAPGTGWPDARNFGFAGVTAWRANSPAGNLVYADPDVVADRFDVYYMRNTSFGTLTMTATGGSAVVQNTAGAAGILKATVSAASPSAANALTIAATGQVYVVAIEPWLSTTSTIRIGNAGVPSTTLLSWNDATTFKSLQAIAAYAPDLTIIGLGVNDAGTTGAGIDAATYMSRLSGLVTAAALTGDVVCLTPVPSQTASQAASEASYQAALIASTYPVIDLFGRAGSYAAMNALGFMADDRHPNSRGYGDLVLPIAAALAA